MEARPQRARPAQVKRDSFAHYFSPLKERNEVTWAPTPLEALLDVDQLVATWRRRGLTIHRARSSRLVERGAVPGAWSRRKAAV